MVEAETDPEHVAADVGDAVARCQCGLPLCGAGMAEGEEAGVGAAIERVQEFGFTERRRGDGGEQLRLEGGDAGRDRRGVEPFVGEHPADRVPAVERARVEGRAHETHRVAGIADPVRWKGQIVEFGIPAGQRGACSEAGRAVHQAKPLPRHRIFIAAAEVEEAFREVRAGSVDRE